MTDDNHTSLFNWGNTASPPSPPPAEAPASAPASAPTEAPASASLATTYLFGPYATMVATLVLLLIIQPPFVRQRSPPYDLSYTRLFSWVVASGALSAAAEFFLPSK